MRVLQERTIEPLGSVKPIKVDVRVIAATNKDLGKLVEEGTFRDDLYYRVRVVQLDLPELRQRREDIPLLVDRCIRKFNKLFSKDIAGVSDIVMNKLMDYEYPGNVRELENILEHAFILCRGGLIEEKHLPPEIRGAGSSEHTGILSMSLSKAEEHMITEALKRHHGNRSQAAETLGIDPSTLYRKIKALNIKTPERDGRSRGS